MKQANNNRKLNLQKKTVKKLSVVNMVQIRGGGRTTAGTVQDTVPPSGTR
jgi:hypothetical protein